VFHPTVSGAPTGREVNMRFPGRESALAGTPARPSARARARHGVAAALLAAALPCLFAPPATASLSVSPAYLDLVLGRSRPSRTLTVTNVTDRETRYRVQVVHFHFTPDGNVAMIPADARSLAPWLKCSPREFTLPPRAARVVRLTLVPPASLGSGEYWGAVWFEPLDERATPADSLRATAGVRTQINILVPVFATLAPAAPSCELTGLAASRSSDGISITARLANTGSRRVQLKGRYEVLAPDSTRIAEGPLGDDTILPGGERVFRGVAHGGFPREDCVVRVRYSSPRLPADFGGLTAVQR
jgi:hypothetical protein